MSKRQRLPQIHMVMANHDYSGATPVRAFVDETKAEEFAAACRRHDALQPECPEIEDSPENDALWVKWQVKHARWAKRHPAGATHNPDRWTVQAIPFDPMPPHGSSHG